MQQKLLENSKPVHHHSRLSCAPESTMPSNCCNENGEQVPRRNSSMAPACETQRDSIAPLIGIRIGNELLREASLRPCPSAPKTRANGFCRCAKAILPTGGAVVCLLSATPAENRHCLAVWLPCWSSLPFSCCSILSLCKSKLVVQYLFQP